MTDLRAHDDSHAAPTPWPTGPEDRFFALLENVHLLGVILDPQGRVRYANPFLLATTGWTQEEAVGADWFGEFLVTEDAERVREIYATNIAMGHVRPHSSNTIRSRDGTRHHVDWNSTVILAPDGSVDSVAAIGQDMTAQRVAEDAARATWASTTAALDASSDTIAIFHPVRDADGRFLDAEIVYLNEIARTRWLGGRSLDELRGAHLFDVQPTIQGLIGDLYALVVETGTPFRGHREFETALGHRVFDLSITAFDGGFVHVGRDVTDERRAIERLRASEEQLRRTLEGVDAIVGYQERAGGELVLSPQVEQFLGYPPEAIRTLEAWNALVHPDDVEACRAVWSDEPAAWELEYRMRRADGTWIWIADRGRRLEGVDGGEPGMFGVMVDVTALRALEGQLRQAQRLDALGQLAGGIAHDFNNLLAAIRGNVELALAGITPGSVPASDLAEAIRASDRAAELTRQLLLFSRRSESPAGTVTATGPVIEGLATMLRRLLGEHIDLALDLAPVPAAVRIDPGRLEQVVVNLAINARDAMPAGGRLRVATDVDGDDVRLIVEDSGTGMDDATAARVFDPFFTTKAPGKGTGLGLATVHAIVTQAGGTIAVRTAPGAGTTFTVRLPRWEAADDEPVAATGVEPGVPAQGGGETVLLVEDEPAVREVVARSLRAAGYRVLAAASGADALDEVDAWGATIDLLVSDVRMPGMQGPELARRVRASLPAIPVLFVSALAAELDEATLAMPGVHLLEKPFDLDTLRATVRGVIDGAATG